jgi:uncharacterized protein (PEP-CTERM system associated)
MRRVWPSSPGLLVLLLAQAWPMAAQSQTRSQAVSAGLDSRLIYNVDSRLGGRDGAEWIAEVTPSIALQSRSGRVVGSLEYGLQLIERSRREPSSDAVNRLAARFSAEAVPRHLFLEGAASIAQQSSSPFGLQTVSASVNDNPNRAEVGTASLSPVLRGVIGGAVTAEARLNVSSTNTRDSLTGDSTQTGGAVLLSSMVPGTFVSWGLTAQSLETDFRVGRTTRTESATASLGWQADADLSLSLRGGTETQNVQELQSQRTSTWGVGATWRPSPRTRLQANLDDRFFGRGYGVVAEYRLPRTSFSWSSTRDTSNSGGTIEPLTQFDLFMGLLAAEFPDPAAREVAVRNLLTSLGLDPLAVGRPGFVLSSVSLVERHQFGWAWSGQRLNLGVQAFRSTTTAIDTGLSAVEREPVRLSSYGINLGYRLTPTSSLVASGSRQMTQATATQPSNDLKSASLTWSEQVGRRTVASLSARYTVFNSTATPYREAQLSAAVAMRF